MKTDTMKKAVIALGSALALLAAAAAWLHFRG